MNFCVVKTNVEGATKREEILTSEEGARNLHFTEQNFSNFVTILFENYYKM